MKRLRLSRFIKWKRDVVKGKLGIRVDVLAAVIEVGFAVVRQRVTEVNPNYAAVRVRRSGSRRVRPRYFLIHGPPSQRVVEVGGDGFGSNQSSRRRGGSCVALV